MKKSLQYTLVAGLLASALCAENATFPYKATFAVKDAVIVDQDGRKESFVFHPGPVFAQVQLAD